MIVPPCPFCGGKVKLRRGLPNMGNSKTKWGFLQCLQCGAKTAKYIPKPDETTEEFRERVLNVWRKK